MKAAVLDRSASGGFRVAELPVPQPAPDEVIIRLSAASINPIETMMRNGYGDSLFKWLRPSGPRVLGLDGAGVISAVGRNVKNLREGDSVMAATWPFKAGFYAEYVQVPAAFVARTPRKLAVADAAALPYAGLTALQVLKAARLGPESSQGKRVLVHGGSGGIGSLMVQWLHAWGAWVATTCGTANVEAVRRLGADMVIDYRREKFTDKLSGLDVVVNTIAPKTNNLDEGPHLSVLRPGGTYASLISPTLTLADALGAPLGLAASGMWMGGARAYWAMQDKRHRWVYFKPSAEGLELLAEWTDNGTAKPVIAARYPLEQVGEAHRRVEQGGAGGKVLLTFGSNGAHA